MKKKRLDEILIEKGLAKDKDEAFIVATEGRVFVGGQKAVSPAQLASEDSKIEIRGEREFVGRGAYKLGAAIKKFGIDVSGKICADIGSATGGFTEVLLKNGAKKVYAVDTARGKLDLKLREDQRVVVMEGTDVRDIKKLPESVNLITIDVSLIPLGGILGAARRFLKHANSAPPHSSLRSSRFGNANASMRISGGSIIALFKPQYETRDPKILKHGVVENSEAHKKLLDDFIRWAKENGWEVLDWIESPIKGSEGNVEYLLWLR